MEQTAIQKDNVIVSVRGEIQPYGTPTPTPEGRLIVTVPPPTPTPYSLINITPMGIIRNSISVWGDSELNFGMSGADSIYQTEANLDCGTIPSTTTNTSVTSGLIIIGGPNQNDKGDYLLSNYLLPNTGYSNYVFISQA